jgi:hypothetical protein
LWKIADQFEQHTGFGLILADISDVVEDQQVILVELGDRAFEGEFAARDLQALDEIVAERHGDANNAILAAVGYNFRRLIRWLKLLLALVLLAISPPNKSAVA